MKRDLSIAAEPVSADLAPRASALFDGWWMLAIAVLCTLAYLPIWRAGFVWDDDAVLTANKFVKASDGLYRLWFTAEPQDYWPITYTSLWLEWRLWGMNATGYHVTNLLFHVVEVFLIWRILTLLGVPGAKLAATLFAVHPVNVETVAWIAQRKNLTAMLFFLLALWCFIKTGLLEAPREKRFLPPGRQRWYWLCLVMFVLAVLGKGSAVILPPILALLIWWRRPVAVWDVTRLAPFFASAALLTLVNVWFQFHGFAKYVRDDTLLERVLGAAAATWFYLAKALWPQGLMFVYPRWDIRIAELRWWLPLLMGAAMTVLLWRFRNRGTRAALVAWGFFCLALLPVMGFADIYFMRYSLVADHYQHIALLGVVVFVSASWDRWFQRTTGKIFPNATACVAIGGLAALTFFETGFYRDSDTLWRETLKRNPSCALAYNNLGVTLAEAGRWQEAAEHYRHALVSDWSLPETHFSLAKALAQIPGASADAIRSFEEALTQKPEWADAHLALATVLAAEPARHVDAVAHFETALRLQPDLSEAHVNLALLLGPMPGRLEDALQHGEVAVRLKPDSAEAHFNHANNLARVPQRLPEAIKHLETVLQLKPEHAKAHINLGLILTRMPGRLPEAIAHYETALHIDPRSAVVHNNLAIALFESGQADAALTHFEQAVQLDPSYIDARNNLTRLKAMRANAPQP